jgi:hypothetical protein
MSLHECPYCMCDEPPNLVLGPLTEADTRRREFFEQMYGPLVKDQLTLVHYPKRFKIIGSWEDG